MHILVIEDDFALVRMQVRWLARIFQTAEIVYAYAAQEAIDLLIVREYDLVVSDYDLKAGGCGATVLAWLHANRPAQVKRFMFLSSNEECGRIHDRWLDKPADFNDYERTVKEVACRA